MEESKRAEQAYFSTGETEALDSVSAHWEHLLFHTELPIDRRGDHGTHVREDWRLSVRDLAGRLFLCRYLARGSTGDLERALTLWAQVLEEVPMDSPARPEHLFNLGVAYRKRHDRTGQMTDLEEAITLYREALSATSPESPGATAFLSDLGAAIHIRYERTGRMEDLEEAIALYRKAFDAVSPDAPNRWDTLTALCVCLFERYGRTGRMECLDETIVLCREVLDAILPDSPDWHGMVDRLGVGLLTRHRRTDRTEDLEEAIAVLRKATEAPTDDTSLLVHCGHLGTCLRVRYARTGRMEDLEEAIALFQRVRATIAIDAPQRAMILNNLAVALRNRHEQTGRMEDLQESIALYRYNIEATAPDSPDFPTCVFNLGYSLGARYMQSRQMEDLQEAIAITRQALDAIPVDSPVRPAWLKELGRWLELRYEATDRVEDLMDANAVHREAARLQRELDSAAGMDSAVGIHSGYTVPREVACARCGPATVSIQLIFDLEAIQQRPEVVDAIRDGTIHQVVCPTCGIVLGAFDEPLLLYCARPEPTLIFSPAQRGAAGDQSTDERNQEVAEALVSWWRTSAGERAAGANPSMVEMPRPLLPVVVDDGVEVARARLAEAPVDPVAAAVLRLLDACSPEHCYRVLLEHPELAGERAEALLVARRDRLLEDGDERVARAYDNVIRLLRRCREIGIGAAIQEMFGSTPDDVEELDAMIQAPQSIRDGVREAERQKRRYARTGDMEALDMAAACWERVLSDPGLDQVSLHVKMLLSFDAHFLFLRRGEARGERADLDRAVTGLRHMLLALPSDSSVRPLVLAILPAGLKSRYTRTAQSEDLEEAIALCRQAIATSTPGSPYLARFLYNLSEGLLMRRARTGQVEDLEEAVAVCRRSLDMNPTHPRAVAGLAGALHIRHDQTGNLEDLEESISITRQARDPSSPDRAACLSTLGTGLVTRYNRLGKVEDLEEAIAVFRQDLDAISRDSPEVANRLSNLGGALQVWYEWTWRIEDLQEAVALLRRAVDANPLDASALSALGAALRKRAERTGRREDLHERVALFRRALAASTPDSPQHDAFQHAVLLSNLSVALADRHEDTHRREDLDEAVTCFVRALEAVPQNSPYRPKLLSKLANCLNAVYVHSGRTDAVALQVAIDGGRQAVNSASMGDPKRTRILGTLGNSLRHQYNHTGRMEDLEEAIAVYRQALAVTSPDRLHRPEALLSLARALHTRHEATGSMEDLQEAVTVCREALELSRTRDPGIGVYSACDLGRWAFQRSAWEEAVAAYGEAMTIMDTLCEAQLLRSDKYRWLSSVQMLYTDAAYSKARLGDLPGAVLAMETGRARVLTEMLDRTRSDLEEIEKRAPELVHRYRQMLAQLRHLEGVAASEAIEQTSAKPEHDGRLPEQLRAARVELHATVEAIRAAPGGASFLARPSLEALSAALEPGVPVIYLATTWMGGIALVVSDVAGALDVTPLWLDSLSTPALVEMLRGSRDEPTPGSWLGDYMQWQQRPDDPHARGAWHERIERTARALWDMAMGPLVGLLKERFPESERAVLVPNGLLALLPLHAAWTDEDGDRRRWALDAMAFHYAPSLRTLAHARDLAGTSGQTKLLVVDEPRPTSASPLPNSRYEVDAAAARFAEGDVTRMAGELCRRDDVLAAIADAQVCHFSCHGKNDWSNPLQSGLLMADDELLTVKDLLALRGRQARLAVLSACETGIVGTEVPDEVVALPAAFLQAGFACAVASLWSVYDISASLLMARFYEFWLKEHLTPAVALRRAQIWLRELTSRELAAHLEQLVPELAPRMSLDTAAALHLRALLQDPGTRPFAAPVHWAAFYLTGS
ncbi:CHAT domain-containing protein [Sorangium sp. So ce726]|uniref:CHAT domain-containing protein n=1 Tax=Sorangium sp. So ce726 TaxID=3133319 RepID=UPI003F63F69E